MNRISLISLILTNRLPVFCAILVAGVQPVRCSDIVDSATYPVRVELRLNSTSRSFRETKEDVIGECTGEFIILVTFAPESDGAEPPAGSERRAYHGVVLDASLSTVCAPEDYRAGKVAAQYENLDKLRGRISEGELRAVISVDRNGRWEVRSDIPEEISEQSQTYFGVIASMFSAPVPPDGKPFETGMKWKYKAPKDNDVFTCEHSVECESVRVWPSGETRIVLTSEGELEKPERPVFGGGFPEIREEGEWILGGNPPAVRQATGHQWSQFQNRIMDATTTVRLLEGAIPIRP
jgi:hypothetical protein